MLALNIFQDTQVSTRLEDDPPQPIVKTSIRLHFSFIFNEDGESFGIFDLIKEARNKDLFEFYSQ